LGQQCACFSPTVISIDEPPAPEITGVLEKGERTAYLDCTKDEGRLYVMALEPEPSRQWGSLDWRAIDSEFGESVVVGGPRIALKPMTDITVYAAVSDEGECECAKPPECEIRQADLGHIGLVIESGPFHVIGELLRERRPRREHFDIEKVAPHSQNVVDREMDSPEARAERGRDHAAAVGHVVEDALDGGVESIHWASWNATADLRIRPVRARNVKLGEVARDRKALPPAGRADPEVRPRADDAGIQIVECPAISKIVDSAVTNIKLNELNQRAHKRPERLRSAQKRRLLSNNYKITIGWRNQTLGAIAYVLNKRVEMRKRNDDVLNSGWRSSNNAGHSRETAETNALEMPASVKTERINKRIRPICDG
jgi:hypothetical protein